MLAMVVVCVYSQATNDQKIINPTGCGRRLSAFTGRRDLEAAQDDSKIVGGTAAQSQDWNWQVALRTNGRFFCGGSLANSIWVVTAAHCTQGMTVSTLSVLLGGHNIGISESWTTTRTVGRVIQHASYNGNTMRYDISLIKMSSAVTYTTQIGPVCIAAQGASYANQNAVATGWGATFSGGSASTSALRQVTLRVRTDAECTSSFSTGSIHTASMLCAGLRGDGLDTCQGDSGGPLVWGNSQNIWYLIGATSWGIGCGDVGVYAHVAQFNTWISSNIANN